MMSSCPITLSAEPSESSRVGGGEVCSFSQDGV